VLPGARCYPILEIGACDPRPNSRHFYFWHSAVLLVTGFRESYNSPPSGHLAARSSVRSPALFCNRGWIFFLTRKWVFRLRTGVLATSIYYAVLTRLYYGRFSWVVWRIVPHYTAVEIALFLIGPCVGFPWMLYAYQSRQGRFDVQSSQPRLATRTLTYALAAFCVLVIPWLPARNRSVAHPRNMSSVIITMARGHCFGSCPVYSLTIHGNGGAEYHGSQFVRTKGPENATISSEKVGELLQSFDRERFFALDDRAFENCFDTPYTTVTISVDGASKRVTGDTCFGKSWPKMNLLNLAQEIDDLAGSSQWVQCHGSGCIWR
jgi:hypothetical protein